MSRPSSCLTSVPAYLASLSDSDSFSRKRSSSGSKSISLRKLRFLRLNAMGQPPGSVWSERRIAFERTGHAVPSAATLAELEALDGDDLDARLAQGGVRPDVALVGHHDAGLQGHDVVAVVPLFALGLEGVPAGLHHAHRPHAEGHGHDLGERPLLLLDHQVVRR